jgi:ABC-type antimicrobial peptide transport system ATPase subunit
LPAGCPFHPRCRYVMERCRVERPLLEERGPYHFAACHLEKGMLGMTVQAQSEELIRARIGGMK